MPGLRAVLLLPVLLLPARAQATNRADAWLRSQQGPVMVLLEPVAKDPGFWLRLQTLLEEDPLADRTLTPLQLHQGRQISPLADALQASFRLGQARWALLAPPDRMLASGRELPRAQALADALQGAGIASPLQILRDFLREHPDHLEARLDYLQRLRIPAENRTRKALGLSLRRDSERIADGETRARLAPRGLAQQLPPKGKELSAKDDERIWGTLARELDRVFAQDDWLEMDSLFRSMRNLPLEAASPLMIAVYQRHRTRILEILRRDPANTTVQATWAWMQVVLREPLLPVYRTLPTSAADERPELFGYFGGPGQLLLRVLVDEAHEGGDWKAAQPVLAELCRSLMETFFSADNAWIYEDPSSDKGKELRTGAWELMAIPYLEACLRTGREGDAGIVLDAAAKAAEAPELLQAAASKARQLGRADLARTWAVWKASEEKPVPMLLRWGRQCRFVLLNPPREANGWELLSSPQLMGFDLWVIPFTQGRGNPETQRLHEELRQFIGWTGPAPRWALLDPKGKVLDQGQELPEAARLEVALRRAGIIPRLERLQKQLHDDPDDPRPLAPLFAEMSKRFLRTGITEVLPTGWKRGDPPPKSILNPEGQAQFPALLETSRRSLEAGYWRRTGVSASREFSWQAFPWASRSRIDELQPMTDSWLEAVEDALIRNPTRWEFWDLWASLRKVGTDRPVQLFFARLAPDPLRVGRHTWPPLPAVEALIREYRTQEKWSELEALGRSRWDLALERAERMRAAAGANPARAMRWNIDVAPLVEALLQLGRSADADGIVQAWAGMGGQMQGLDPLAALAGKLGFESLAAAWREQAKSAGRGGPR